MESDYSRLCKTILGDPEQRKRERKERCDRLEPPTATFVLGDSESKEIWGVWKTKFGIFIVRQSKDGLYDPHPKYGCMQFTTEQVETMYKVLKS